MHVPAAPLKLRPYGAVKLINLILIYNLIYNFNITFNLHLSVVSLNLHKLTKYERYLAQC